MILYVSWLTVFSIFLSSLVSVMKIVVPFTNLKTNFWPRYGSYTKLDWLWQMWLKLMIMISLDFFDEIFELFFHLFFQFNFIFSCMYVIFFFLYTTFTYSLESFRLWSFKLQKAKTDFYTYQFQTETVVRFGFWKKIYYWYLNFKSLQNYTTASF